MKRVAYHRLAARELVDSALFYDQRRVGLGEELLNEVEALLLVIRAHTELGRPGPHGLRRRRRGARTRGSAGGSPPLTG
jgi:hypothetical protein